MADKQPALATALKAQRSAATPRWQACGKGTKIALMKFLAKKQLPLLAATNIALTALHMGLILMESGFAATSDGYFSAQAVLVYLFAIIGSITTRPLMPFLTSLKGEDILALSVGALGGALLVAGLLHGIAATWLDSLTRLLLLGADETRLTLTRDMLEIMLWSAPLFAACSCFQAIGQHQGKFIQVEVICIGSHFVSIGVLLLLVDPVAAIGYSYLVRFAVRALVMSIFFPWRYILTADIGRVWRLTRTFMLKAGQLIGGSAFFKMIGLLDVFFTSFLSDGTLSLVKFIQFLYSGITGIANRAYFMPFVRNAGVNRDTNHQSFAQQLMTKVPLVGLVSAGAAVAVIGGLMVALQIGLLSGDNISYLQVLVFAAILAVAMAGDVWGNTATALFYARSDMVTPTTVGIVGMTVAVAHKYLLTSQFEGIGLVTSTALHYFVNALVLHYLLHKRGRGHATL